MTRAQDIINNYIDTIFTAGTVKKIFSMHGSTVTITDLQGGKMNLAVNIYGDILNAETREVIAESNAAHDLDALDAEQLPTAWKTIHPQGIITAAKRPAPQAGN